MRNIHVRDTGRILLTHFIVDFEGRREGGGEGGFGNPIHLVDLKKVIPKLILKIHWRFIYQSKNYLIFG